MVSVDIQLDSTVSVDNDLDRLSLSGPKMGCIIPGSLYSTSAALPLQAEPFVYVTLRPFRKGESI